MLDSEKLPKAEKFIPVTEVLQCSTPMEWEPLSDEELVLNAEILFLKLDANEDCNGNWGQGEV